MKNQNRPNVDRLIVCILFDLIDLMFMAVGIDFKLRRVLLNYRTGSGSDLAVSLPLNQTVCNKTQDQFEQTVESVGTARSLHHPKRAARLGTPVRFLFCS